MADNVDLTITAKNATQAAFAEVSKALKALEDATDQQGSKTKSLGDQIAAYFTKDVDVFGLAEKGALAAGAAIATAAVGVVALGTHGAAVADVANNFDLLNAAIGNVGSVMLGTLQEATGHTISDFELMKGLNLGLSDGLRLNAKDAQTLGEAARVLADRIGGDNVTAYNSLIEAMATGRSQMLNQIGIHIDATAAEEKYAASIGVTRDQLTDQQKVIAHQQATMEAMRQALVVSGKAEDDFGDAVDRAKTLVANFTNEVAVGIANSPVFAAGIDEAGHAIADAFGGDEQDLVKEVVHWIDQGAIVAVDFGIAAVGAANVIATAWDAIKLLFNITAMQLVGEVTAITVAIAKMAELATKVPGIGDKFQGVADGAAAASRFMKDLTGDIYDNVKASAAGVAGHDALHQSIDKAGGVLLRMRDQMVAASEATHDNTTSTTANTGAHASNADAVTTQAKAYQDFVAKLAQLNQALGVNKTLLSDDQFLKVYGSDLEKAWQSVEQFGVAWDAIPSRVQAAMQRLTAIQTEAIVTQENAIKSIGVTWTGVGQDIIASQSHVDDAVSQAIDKVLAAHKAAAKTSEGLATEEAQWAIDEAKRRGASEAAVYQATAALLTQQTGAAIAARMQQFEEETRTLDLTVQANRDAYDAMQADATADINKISAEWQHGIQQAQIAAADAGDVFGLVDDQLKTLASDFQTLAQVSGGSFSGFAKEIGTTITALQLAHDAVGNHEQETGLVGGLDQIADGHTMAGVAKLTGGIVGIASAFMQATESGGTFSKTVNGALVGAEVGSEFGAIGTAIGAAAGAIGGALRGLFGGVSQEEKDARTEADKFRASLVDLFNDTASAQEQAQVGSDAWAQANAAVADAYVAVGYTIDDALADLQALDAATHQNAAAVEAAEAKITAVLQEQKDAATFLQTTLPDTFKTVAESGALVTPQFAAIVQQLTDMGAATEEVDAFVTGQLQGAVGGIADFVNNATVTSQSSADAMIAALSASFHEMTADGMSASAVMATMAPTIETLEQQLQAAGLQGGAAFDQILQMADIASGEISGPAITAIQGAGTALVDLQNAGVMDQQMFSGLSSQITDTFTTMVAQGTDGSAALALIAPQVQEIWELQQDFGFQVDDSTQKLIDQAVAAGMVGDAQRDAQQVATQAMQDAATAMDHVADVLERVFGTAAEQGVAFADRVTDAINGIPSNKDITITTYQRTIDEGTTSADTGLQGIEIPGAAAGGLFSQPTFRIVAESQPEIVGTPNVIVDALAQAMARSGFAAAGSGGGAAAAAMPTSITIPVYIGDRQIDQVVADVTNRNLANGAIRVPRRTIVERV